MGHVNIVVINVYLVIGASSLWLVNSLLLTIYVSWVIDYPRIIILYPGDTQDKLSKWWAQSFGQVLGFWRHPSPYFHSSMKEWNSLVLACLTVGSFGEIFTWSAGNPLEAIILDITAVQWIRQLFSNPITVHLGYPMILSDLWPFEYFVCCS